MEWKKSQNNNSRGGKIMKIDRHDKVAKMAQSLSQDVGRRFKEEVLRKIIYPEKNYENWTTEELVTECKRRGIL